MHARPARRQHESIDCGWACRNCTTISMACCCSRGRASIVLLTAGEPLRLSLVYKIIEHGNTAASRHMTSRCCPVPQLLTKEVRGLACGDCSQSHGELSTADVSVKGKEGVQADGLESHTLCYRMQVPCPSWRCHLDATICDPMVCSSWQAAIALHTVQRHHCRPPSGLAAACSCSQDSAAVSHDLRGKDEGFVNCINVALHYACIP